MTDLKPDRAEVAALYRAHAGRLLRFVAGVVGDADLAEEALQRTFVRVLERGGPSAPEAWKSWLSQVALREALQVRRGAAARERNLAQLATTLADRVPEAADGEEPMLEEWRDRVASAIERLPPDQRHVLEQRVRAGKTFAVIAAEQERPIGTVLTRMRLALEKLKRWVPE